MIAQFFKPQTVADVLALKTEYGDKAGYLAGGSKFNAAFAKHKKTVAISLSCLGLDRLVRQGKTLEIGATVSLQTLIDDAQVPVYLKQAARLLYSRHLRNQATIGGEIAATQDSSVLLPLLLVIEAQLVLENDRLISLEEYLSSRPDALIQKVIIEDHALRAATCKVSHMVDGLITLTAAVALTGDDKHRIALDGVASQAIRLSSVESQNLEGEALEKAVSKAIRPEGDLLRGSAEYKTYIAGVVVADLLADCQQQGRA